MNLSKPTITGLAVLVTFLCIAQPLCAQQNDDPADSTARYEMDEIIISANRFESSPSTVGRNVTVIGQSEIQNSVYSSVGELLARQQNTHITGYSHTPGSLQNVFLRNTNSNHTVVMIDGIRISDPSSTGNSVDLTELSTAGVQRIEIVRGSHSTLYGSSAIGGVINIITKKSDEPGMDLNLDTQFSMLRDGYYGTQNNASFRNTLENGFYTSLAVSQHYTNGFDATLDTTTAGGFNPQDRDGFRKLDLHGKVGFSNNGFDIYGAFRRVEQSVDLDSEAYADDDNAKQDLNRNLFNYWISKEITGWLNLNFEGGYSTLKRHFVNDSSIVDQQGNYDNTFTESRGDGTILENKLLSTFSIDRSKVILGLESNRQTMDFLTYTYISSFDFESETDLGPLGLKENINSIFLHSDLSGSLLNESLDNVSLVMGGRLADHNRFGTHFTYEVNPRVRLTPSSTIYGAVTSGFNAPSLYKLHAPEQGFGAITNRGNAGLNPEESVSYELGWRQDIGNSARIELSLFRTNVKNVIEYVYLWHNDTPVPNLNSQDYLGDTYINISKQHIRGAELGFDIQAISNVSITGNLNYSNSESIFSPGDINSSYTGGHHVQIFESGKFINDEKKVDGLPRRPNISASVQIDYLPTSKWRIGLSSQFVGDRDDIFYSSELGPFGALDRSNVSNYNVTDLSLQYRFNRLIRLTGKIENILDTEYTEINGYRTRGRGLLLKASFAL